MKTIHPLTLLPTLTLALGLIGFQGCNGSESEEKCAGDTTSLIVLLTVPAGISPAVTLTGPNGYSVVLTASDTLSGLAAGAYTASYKRVKVPGALVGKAYYGKISETEFSLTACAAKTITVEYLQEPGSERAYVIERGGIRAFAAAKLATTGSPTADNTLKTPAGAKGLAFDARGNLWFSHAEGVSMYAMEDLAKADAAYRVRLTGAGVMGAAIPGAGPLAFDDQGNLWIGQIASDKVVRLTPAQLASTGSPVPAVSLANPDLDGVLALAFDSDGNLWATNADNEVVMYAKSRLAASQTGPADVNLVHMSAPPVIGTYSDPQSLAFDAQGNLWIGFFAGNDLVRVPKASLGVSDTIQPPDIALKGNVTALLEGLAFDEAGGAWMPGKADELVKAGAARLTATGALTADVVLTSPDIDYADEVAFNPAPEALPLRD